MDQKIYSVLGDSVSTFSGYSPEEAVFYDRWIQGETGITSVEDTWWMQVISKKGARLGRNDSYAGSMVSGNLETSATSDKRIKNLSSNGTPDVILVNMGANDWGFCVLPEEFEDAYRKLLCNLKAAYPYAVICCATLMEGRLDKENGMNFFNAESCISKRIYSEIIRKCVKEAGAVLVDLERYGQEYAAIDGVHPVKAGMDTMAELWLKELVSLDDTED